MRHSDIRLTMKLYTDVSKLPVREAVAGLPSFGNGISAVELWKNPVDNSDLKLVTNQNYDAKRRNTRFVS
jgi:hypothetical protein